ncbi:MAG TPA: plasmid pRiA4b ORF-3 family protein [Pirellulales bacterium]|nr:plasmid pRiA4b ORF-3 family protein [Pirellulales bacterium]
MTPKNGVSNGREPKTREPKTREPKTRETEAILYQFKLTLLDVKPPIWRRIQVWNCTLDKLHEHIQTAMGWTNSHLHQFKIDDRLYGDPLLMEDNFETLEYVDSTSTELRLILPKGGQRLRFSYEYDFGDGWEHEVLFEGCPNSEPGKRYPVCLEGERSCPPEDVGGVDGYAECLAVLADPKHDEHKEMRKWVGGEFHAERFDPAAATKTMLKGLPDWRRIGINA